MATLAEHRLASASNSLSPMPVINRGVEPEMEAFVNLDQLTYTSSEPARTKLAALPTQTTPIPNQDFMLGHVRSAAAFASSGQSPLAFQAPSHQYDEHKQQTGLPPGALAQAIGLNHVNAIGFGSGRAQFAMGGPPMDGGHSMNRERGSIDFGLAPVGNPLEMDMEMDNVATVPALMFTPSQDHQTQFIDPTTLGGQEPVVSGPSTQVGRMYPGMHQQQAAMARAAQQQQQQLQQQRQQQQKQQELPRPQQVQQRRPEDQAPQAGTPSHRPTQHPDPVVEERITRLLQQMRQNIVVSDEDAKLASHLPHVTRSRKDEQDMDEDERLLASEEGKKLTSKERRQLRNKVSARAFRSRRKEYIGQLENEIAAKTKETQELRLQNRALVEENSRLSDLARMLLASPHFSSFLEDLSVNGLPAPQPQTQAQQQQPMATTQPQHPATQPPSVTPQPPVQHEAAREGGVNQGHVGFEMSQNPQAGIIMMPTQPTNVVPTALDSVGWNTGIDLNFGNPTVFSVLDVPEPCLSPGDLLSGKGTGVSSSPLSDSKENFLSLDHPTAAEARKTECGAGVMNPDVDIDESDPAFALFLDGPDASASRDSHDMMTDPPFTRSMKADPAIELVVDGTSTNASAAAWYRFQSLCHSIEPAFQRISLLTSHLS